jgi:hypothetical protein
MRLWEARRVVNNGVVGQKLTLDVHQQGRKHSIVAPDEIWTTHKLDKKGDRLIEFVKG